MALPELYKQQDYKRQTFDKDAEFRRLYGMNASRRDTRKFNRYWNSDQRINDEKAFNAAQDAAELAHIQSEQKKYFDSMDAHIAAAREQNAARGAAALNSINTSLATKPAVPVSKPDPTPVTKTLIPRSEADWNRIASEATNGQLKTMADVEAWQRANGFSEDQIDGKFGDYSKSYFDKHSMGSYIDPIEVERLAKEKAAQEEASKQQAWLNHMRGLGYTEVVRDDGTRHFVNGNTMYMNNGRMQVGNTKMDYDYTTLTRTPVGSSTFDLESWAKHNQLATKYFDGKLYARYDPSGDGDFWVGTDGNVYESGLFGGLGHVIDKSFQNAYYKPTSIRGKHFNDLSNLLKIPYNKQGGTMNRINYFQQGGAAPQQDIKAQVTALVQAAMQGDQKATQQVNQIMEAAKAGDQQAIQIAQLMEQVIKEIQGQAVAAKYGAKLSYLQALKCGGKSMKKKEQGGKVCPECEKEKIIKKNYFGGSVDKFGDGGETRQPNKKNLRFFDRRSTNIGNDRQVITETVYDYDDGYGNWLGDLAKILGTRTIYKTPTQNDTVYSYTHDPKIYLGTNTGYMGVAKQEADQNGAKTNFLQQVRTTVLPENQNTEEAKARRRAWIEGE